MKRFITSKKGLALLATLVVSAVAAVGAYAYFTSTGSGTGSASVGSHVALTITQTNTISGLVPDGTAHTVAYSIDNTANTFAQNLGKVTVSNIAVDTTHANAGCLATWFTANAPTDPVGTIAASSTYPSVAGTQPSVQMNDSGSNQSSCEGATLTLTLTGAQGS
jgi:hypothetical protein